MGSSNWIVDNLNSVLETWNGKLAEIWTLLSTGPEAFKGGGVWTVIVRISDGLKAISYALLVIFFVMGVVKTCGSFTEVNHNKRNNFKQPTVIRLKSRVENRPAKFTDKEYSITIQ